ncbi:MAG: hypothetical protein M1833_004333 [Piccolia ochrophora]|nr:MAG: hypothetical protein M1833_004333 [Piccolia ochrophora]
MCLINLLPPSKPRKSQSQSRSQSNRSSTSKPHPKPTPPTTTQPAETVSASGTPPPPPPPQAQASITPTVSDPPTMLPNMHDLYTQLELLTLQYHSSRGAAPGVGVGLQGPFPQGVKYAAPSSSSSSTSAAASLLRGGYSAYPNLSAPQGGMGGQWTAMHGVQYAKTALPPPPPPQQQQQRMEKAGKEEHHHHFHHSFGSGAVDGGAMQLDTGRATGRGGRKTSVESLRKRVKGLERDREKKEWMREVRGELRAEAMGWRGGY